MIENTPWAEYAVDPDRYIKELEAQEEEMNSELYRLRQELRLVKAIKKQKDMADAWRTDGIPEQRRSGDVAGPESAELPLRSGGQSQHPTRKERILGLLAQDPHRQWKVNDVVSALGDPNTKSVRVTMDDLVRAGKLNKLPGSIYQLGGTLQAIR